MMQADYHANVVRRGLNFVHSLLFAPRLAVQENTDPSRKRHQVFLYYRIYR